MKESIEKRIKAIQEVTETPELKKCLCPFFEKGGNPDCITCRKDDVSLEECRDYYLERILLTPLDIWNDSFDRFIVQSRDKVELEDVVGIGVNCDNCYMADKCPLYKRGFVCGINWGSKKPTTPAEFMDFLIDLQFERVKRAQVHEKIDGGVPDANLSGEMDRLSSYIGYKSEMGRDRFSINVEASSAPTSEGGGILAKLFGGGVKPEPKALPDDSSTKNGVIDITDAEIIEEKVPAKRKRK